MQSSLPVWFSCAAVLLACSAGRAAEPAAPKLAVMPLEAVRGVEPEVVELLDGILTVHVDHGGGYEVLSAAEIEALLGLERMRDALGCDVFLPGVWYDERSGLLWEEPGPDENFTIDEAVDYCEQLELDGHDDWRLPDIDELRSLVRGCTPDCNVSATCASTSYGDSCWTNCLEGCFEGKGPGQDGCYRDPALTGSCFLYWSSTQATGVASSGRHYWTVEFEDATIAYISVNDFAELVRCVRTE